MRDVMEKELAPHAGERHPFWRGDDATTRAKHLRSERRHVVDRCSVPGCERAAERHHKDGDPAHNEVGNIEALCRKHHMERDGRMARFMSYQTRPRPKEPKECATCKRPYKPLRKGECKSCAEYRRLYGQARPYVGDGRSERWSKKDPLWREMWDRLIAAGQPNTGGRARRGGGGTS